MIFFQIIGKSMVNSLTLADIVDHNCETRSDEVWLTSPETGQVLTWKEVSKRVKHFSELLNSFGIKEGSSVAVASQNCIASCIAFLGIAYSAFKATPLNLVAGSKSMRYVIVHSETELIFVNLFSKNLQKKQQSATETIILWGGKGGGRTETKGTLSHETPRTKGG